MNTNAELASSAKLRLQQLLVDEHPGLPSHDRRLPMEERQANRLELCEAVETEGASLMQALRELADLHRSIVALEALPSNVLARLCVVSCKITRGKAGLRDGLHRLLAVSRGLAKGILLDEEIQRHRRVLTQRTVALDTERVRVFEADRKLKLAFSQVDRLRSERRILMWTNLASKLRSRQMLDQRARQV
jgi:hypothetical protein